MSISTNPGVNERGFALATTLFTMAMLSALTAAALQMSRADIQAGRNYRSANQGLYAAEAGIKHAVAIINATGTLNVKKDLVEKWPGKKAPFETRPYPMARQANFAYDVIIGPDPYSADPNRALLTSTGTGADNTVRVVTARIKKSNLAYDPPGALHLANANAVSTSFTNSAFKIDGGDNYYGAAGPKSSIPGVSAFNPANATSAENSLGYSQKAQVTGLGYVDNPRKASVSAVPKLSVSEINKIVQNLIDQPGSIQMPSTDIKGNMSLGTIASPRVTRITGNAFTLNGSVTGAGILILDPAVTITGNFEFNGLVIARGGLDINTSIKTSQLGGSSLIQGSLWTTELGVAIGGSSRIQYSSRALQYAEQAAISIGEASFLPGPVDVIGWREEF